MKENSYHPAPNRPGQTRIGDRIGKIMQDPTVENAVFRRFRRFYQASLSRILEITIKKQISAKVCKSPLKSLKVCRSFPAPGRSSAGRKVPGDHRPKKVLVEDFGPKRRPCRGLHQKFLPKGGRFRRSPAAGCPGCGHFDQVAVK